MIALTRPDNIIPMPTKSNEWYTPARYVEAARLVLGGIDLDPASCEMANRTVKATRYYTQSENGLEQPWYGRVWLNPPYGSTNGKSNMRTFAIKLVQEYLSGNVKQAILLTTSRTDTDHFRLLWEYPICFSDHRVAFYRPRKHFAELASEAAHMHGTIFVYLGPHEQTFIEHFSRFGRIARAIDTPAPRPVPLSLWEAHTW